MSASCARDKSSYPNTPQPVSPDKSTTIKVLNRVKCHESYQRYCTQNDINAIWQLCLDSGYVTHRHHGQVISAREITELVFGTARVVETTEAPVERVDEYGFVIIDKLKRVGPVLRESKGYCIGSEYITR